MKRTKENLIENLNLVDVSTPALLRDVIESFMHEDSLDYIPYTGAINDVDLGEQVIILGKEIIVAEKAVHQVYLFEESEPLFRHQTEAYFLGAVMIPAQGFGFGIGALENNLGAESNAFGSYALQSNSGNKSNGFGHNALNTNSGLESNGFGYNALRQNTADFSSGFGESALTENTGVRSSGFGHSCMRTNSGDNSNGFGYFALDENDGNYSNGFGNYALQFNAGNNSTAVGHSALNNVIDTSLNLTAIGYKAGSNEGFGITFTNSTAIGANSLMTKSNQVMLGDTSTEEVKTSGTYVSGGYTVATLPTGVTGARAYVTDSTVAASGNFGATVAGTGSNTVPVFYDGTNWIIA